MHALLTPEARFLLLATGGSANDEALRRVLGRGIDWSVLCALASVDRAIPVVWRRLQRLGHDAPPSVADYLGRAAAVSEFQLLRAERRLRETIHALDAESIRVILLKGAAVAHTAYSSFSERPMGDFDLLVEPARIGDAQRIALSLGWGRSPAAGPDLAYDSHHHAVPLRDTGGTGMQLELHTGLFVPGHPFGLSADTMRRRSRPLDLDGCLVGVPVRSVLILHACLHFAWSHTMRTGAWRTFRDIARLIDGRPQVWDEFTRLAIEARGTTCAYWTLRLARDLAKIPVPSHVLDSLRPPLPELVLARLGRHFAMHLYSSEAVCPSIVVDHAMWTAAVLPGWSGHGPTRPWSQNHEFMPMARATSRAVRTRTSIARHVALRRQWGHYLRALFAGGHQRMMAPTSDGAS
jgi:hypothetical protein